MRPFALSVGYAATSPKGRGFLLVPLYHKSAEKTMSLPKFVCCGSPRTSTPTNVVLNILMRRSLSRLLFYSCMFLQIKIFGTKKLKTSPSWSKPPPGVPTRRNRGGAYFRCWPSSGCPKPDRGGRGGRCEPQRGSYAQPELFAYRRC